MPIDNRALSLLSLSLILSGCEGDDRAPEPKVVDQPETTLPVAIDWSALDPSIDPCDDFYQYACGGWQASNPVPDSRALLTRTQTAGQAEGNELFAIIEADDDGERDDDDPRAQLIGDYYASCMAAPRYTAARTELSGLIAPIMSIQTREDLARQVGTLAALGTSALFGSDIVRDPMHPTRRVLRFAEAGMQLRNRSDYLDSKRQALRGDYRQHIADLTGLMPDLTIDPDAVITVETRLAQAALEPDQRRDPRALYHPMTREELEALVPNFDWAGYVEAAGIGSVSQVLVTEPDYFAALDRLLEQTPIAALRSYLAFQVLQNWAGALDDAVVATDFRFWAEHYSGQLEQAPRFQICYSRVTSMFAYEVAQPYVARYFSDETRNAANALIDDIRVALRSHLESVDWLDEPTRAAALDKLSQLDALVGAPTSWNPDTGLEIDRHSFLMNGVRINRYSLTQAAAGLDRAADRHTWFMSPVTINAEYSPARNIFALPAGILTAPYFVLGDSPLSNYGGIGAVIGHELTHAFDDAGRAFDAGGALHDWWTPEVEQAFSERTQCLVDQFSSYAVADDVHLDGRLTLGENLADLGGVTVAYEAWQKRGTHEAPANDHDSRQQFFLQFAQLSCANERPESLRQAAMTATHSPDRFRVNGTLANVPAFAEAFACPGRAPVVAVTDPDAAACRVW